MYWNKYMNLNEFFYIFSWAFLLIYHFARALGILRNYLKGSNKRKHSTFLNRSPYNEVVFPDQKPQSTELFIFRNSCFGGSHWDIHKENADSDTCSHLFCYLTV